MKQAWSKVNFGTGKAQLPGLLAEAARSAEQALEPDKLCKEL